MAMLFLKTTSHNFMDNNLTVSAYLIDKNTIKETDFSNPIAVRKERDQNPEKSLWIHGDEPEDIFLLQGGFGLHPLSVEAITHQNQPSKIEEYDEYLFTIIDGVRYDESEREEHQKKDRKSTRLNSSHLV